jgi:hypothetical protein
LLYRDKANSGTYKRLSLAIAFNPDLEWPFRVSPTADISDVLVNPNFVAAILRQKNPCLRG